MYKKEEYDFVEDIDYSTYKIYNKRDRSKIIAVCENVFDAQIVVKALTNGLSPVPCDCDDAIQAALREQDERFETELDEAVTRAREEERVDIADQIREAREEGIEEGKELGSAEAYAETKSTLFDPS